MYLHLYKSKGYAFFLAIIPVVMMYRMPFIEIGMATVLIAAGIVYAAIVLLHSQDISFNNILPLIVYYIYVMTKSSAMSGLLCIAVIVHFTIINSKVADVEYLRKFIEYISCIASICVIFQVLTHLLLNIHIPMIDVNLCLEEMGKYRGLILTGIGETGTLYRPSAFFLEPSHLTNYCSIGLASCLFLGRIDYKKAILISIGVLLTTSGMGIGVVMIQWILFPFIATKGVDRTKIKRIINCVVLGSVAIIILYKMPFFQASVNRILGSVTYSDNQYNAIWGRTLFWETYISPMEGKNLLFGYGSTQLPDVYFTGIMTILYSYGILGVILFYFSLIWFFLKSKNVLSKVLIVLYGILMFVANHTGFITMIFYIGSTISIGLYKIEDFEKERGESKAYEKKV